MNRELSPQRFSWEHRIQQYTPTSGSPWKGAALHVKSGIFSEGISLRSSRFTGRKHLVKDTGVFLRGRAFV